MTFTWSHAPPWPRRRARGDDAASLVEYAMMLALIAVVCILAISFFGSSNAGSFTDSADSIANAG